MMTNKWFTVKQIKVYKKQVNDGKKEILTLDLDTMSYRPGKKAKLPL